MPSLSASTVRSDRRAVLLELAAALLSARDPKPLYALVHEHVVRVMPAASFLVKSAAAGSALETVFHSGGGRPELDDDELAQLRAGGIVLRSTGLVLAAPLWGGGGMTGCLVAARETEPFHEEDGSFLRAVGELAGRGLESAAAHAEARRRGEDAEVAEAIAHDLGASLEPGEVVERIALRAHEVIERPVVVWLLDEDRVRAVARGGGALVLLGEERTLPQAALAQLQERASRSSGAAEDPRERRRRLAHIGSVILKGGAAAQRNSVLVPLVLGDRLLGFLAVGPFGDRPPTQEQLRLLHRLAPHAASAIENSRLHGEVRRLSLTDPLSQLPNRRQLDLFLEREFAAAERGRPLCFVLFDLDHFKRYNDTRGHRAGDMALIRFADILRHETRSMNLAARYGGEEFATVLSSTNAAGGQAYGERVRRRVEDVFGGDLTVSGGAAGFELSMKSPIDLVVAADRALYRAKLDGRNRVYGADE